MSEADTTTTSVTTPSQGEAQQQAQKVEADPGIDTEAVKLEHDLAVALEGSPAINPMDELDTEGDEEEEDDDEEEDEEEDGAVNGEGASPVSPSATVVPSNTPVTADSGQGSPTMQSSSESLSDDINGQELTTGVVPDSTTAEASVADPPASAEVCNGKATAPSAASAASMAPHCGQEVGQGEATAAATAQAKDTTAKEAKKLERKEEKKKHKKKEDKGIEYILRALNSLQTPEEKLAALCKKYADLNEEHRVLQTSFKTQQRTMTMVMREKDQLQADHTRAMMAKSKLESLCRELQKHNKIIKEESIKRAKEDDDKRKEISAQFNNTIGEIQTQMSENTERNSKLRQENENLASQLKAFINSIELRDQQVEKLQKHHELEKKLFEAKIKQAEAILSEHTEKSNKERELVMLKLAESNKKNVVLEAQVTMFKDRYAEFEQLHSRSSETFQKYKTEMDKMTKRIKKLEKDGLQWKTKWENTNKALIEQMDERSKTEKQCLTFAQKNSKLESLCRALQAELHNKKPAPVEEAGDGSASDSAGTEATASVPPNSPEASSSGQGSPSSGENSASTATTTSTTTTISGSSNEQPQQPSSAEETGPASEASILATSQGKEEQSVTSPSSASSPSPSPAARDGSSTATTTTTTTTPAATAEGRETPSVPPTENQTGATTAEASQLPSSTTGAPAVASSSSSCDVSSSSSAPPATEGGAAK